VWSTVARRRGGARALRRLKARLVEGRTQGDRERRQNAELIAAADRLVRTAALLHDRATEARRTAQLEESREPLAEPAMQAVSLVAGAPFMSDDAARALGDLAWVDGQLAGVDPGADRETLYGHLSKILVREGQRVSRGQEVGAVGASGRATGTHLHYEVRVNNEPVNPSRYLVN